MSNYSVSIRGEVVDNAKIGTFKNRLGKINDTLTAWANAGACQLVIDGNPNWLKDLFAQDELRLVNGKLSAKGREVKAYVTAHAPINIAEKDGEITVGLTKNRKNRGLFFDPMKKNEEGAPEKYDATERPEWKLSLREFTSAMASDGPGAKNKKAATLANQLQSMAALIAGEKEGVELLGSMEEVMALAQAAHAVAEAATIEASKRKSPTEEVETEAGAQSQAASSGAETRAA